jgi:hypothetical protein
VELPGIEPVSLPGNMRSELSVRSRSFHFSPVDYLPFRSRVLTASSELPLFIEPHETRELGLSGLDYGSQLDCKGVYKHSAWALEQILRTGADSRPLATLRWVTVTKQRYDLRWRFLGKLGLPGMPDESL